MRHPNSRQNEYRTKGRVTTLFTNGGNVLIDTEILRKYCHTTSGALLSVVMFVLKKA